MTMMRMMRMPNLSDEVIHDHNCECDECIAKQYQDKFDKLDCGGCGWCADCDELAHQYLSD